MAALYLALFLLSAGLGLASAEVYVVGDSAGWTVGGTTNYTEWASNKTFEIGDTIVFKYNHQIHNVLQVNKDDFHACITTSPIKVHSTGNDSIVIERKGHYYFICGFPGHCSFGQKVDIRIAKSAAPAPSPLPVPIPGPKPSRAPNALGGASLALAIFGVAAVSGLIIS